MPFLDYLKSKFKKKGRTVSNEGDDPPLKSEQISRVSRRQPKEEPSGFRMPSTAATSDNPSTPVAHVPRPKNSVGGRSKKKDKREESRFNKPITQVAEDVRTKQPATLYLEELHWHSGGVFSNVYRGKLTKPEQMEVAIKKTWPKDSIRSDEMIILAAMRRANPRNIIKLLYIFRNKAPDDTECEAFVFSYMPETLDKAIKRGINSMDTKIYIWQLFNGLDFLAANRIAHRDIKPINILVNRETGELQIGDFGSAKVIPARERSSAYQVTRYYRPPEMLLGSTQYTHLIDVWSAGCVLGEMIKGRVLFRGSDSDHQMQLIQSAFGAPSEDELRAMKVNVKNVKLKNIAKHGILLSLRLQGEGIDPSKLTPSIQAAVALLKRILVFVPEGRLCGKELLEDAFFDDVLSSTCVRDNGRRPNLQRQSDDTMCHVCFERSQKSVRDARVSRMADPVEPEHGVSTMKQPDGVSEEQKNDGRGTTIDEISTTVIDKETAAGIPPLTLQEPPPAATNNVSRVSRKG